MRGLMKLGTLLDHKFMKFTEIQSSPVKVFVNLLKFSEIWDQHQINIDKIDVELSGTRRAISSCISSYPVLFSTYQEPKATI